MTICFSFVVCQALLTSSRGVLSKIILWTKRKRTLQQYTHKEHIQILVAYARHTPMHSGDEFMLLPQPEPLKARKPHKATHKNTLSANRNHLICYVKYVHLAS